MLSVPGYHLEFLAYDDFTYFTFTSISLSWQCAKSHLGLKWPLLWLLPSELQVHSVSGRRLKIPAQDDVRPCQ
jgi:hypothetical protein